MKTHAITSHRQFLLFLAFIPAIFSFSSTANAGIDVLHEFADGSDGAYPEGDLAIGGSTLYGMTRSGGSGSEGTVFKINTDGSGYTVLHNFGPGEGSNGQRPRDSLTLDGTVLYGMTSRGGTDVTYSGGGSGVIFKINTDGSGYEHLHDFDLYNGSVPYGSLTLDNTTLYGMTLSDWWELAGVIFKINTDGSDFTLLHRFGYWTDPSEGCGPRGSLTLDGTTLYGMTEEGGTGDAGVIFKIDNDGQNYEVLHHFDYSSNNGGVPHGSLIRDGTILYGMSAYGGNYNYGVIFRISTDGTGFGLLHSFNRANDGAYHPLGTPILIGSKLYGMCSGGGGGEGAGAIFSINTDGSEYQVLYEFEGYDGSSPYGSLAYDGKKLYGMTNSGGSYNKGVVFAYDLSNPDLIITDIWNDANSIWYQIRNTGDINSPAGHTTTLYINSNVVATDIVDVELPPSGRTTRMFGQYSWQCSQFSDDILVSVDDNDDVAEKDENNNTRLETWKCDNQPPQITSGPTVSNITSTSARIHWITDEDSNSVVKYDSIAGLFREQVIDPNLNLEHDINLHGLKPATTYHFVVESTDQSKNTVSSKEGYFRTMPQGGADDPNIKSVTTVGNSLPMEFSVELFDTNSVDRVEFFIDGNHFETDYSAPFLGYMNPYYLGMDINELGENHQVEVVAYNDDGTIASDTSDWAHSADGDCLFHTVEVCIQRPPEEYVICTDTDSAPPEEIDLIVKAVKTDSVLALLGDKDRPPSGSASSEPTPTWEVIDPNDLDFFLDGNPLPVTHHGLWMEGITENVSHYSFNTGGMSLGSHTLTVRAQTEAGCIVRDRCELIVERNRPNLTISRNVIRNGPRFYINLEITNESDSLVVTLDRVTDELCGFQGVDDDAVGYTVSTTYSPLWRNCHVDIEFTSAPSNTIEPGSMRRVVYMAVPVLYQGMDIYAIGGNIDIDYHDDYEIFHDDLMLISDLDSEGIDIPTSVNNAFKESDYLIVTNPYALFRLHDANSVNRLLSTMADFAKRPDRNGVLGYFNAYGSRYLPFEGTGLMDVGDILGDNKDEFVAIDIGCHDGNDRIKCYSAYEQYMIRGELPIFLGRDYIQTGDVLCAGNVIPEATPGVPHPRAEILLVDGHSSPSAGLGDVKVYWLSFTDTFIELTWHINYTPGEQVLAGNVMEGADWPGDEILVAHHDGVIDIWGNQTTECMNYSTDFSAGDRIALGNVIGDNRKEIIILHVGEDRVTIDDINGAVSGPDLELAVLPGSCQVASGDIVGTNRDEIAVLNHEDNRVQIYDYQGDANRPPTIHRWGPVNFDDNDQLYVCDLIEDDRDEVIVAHSKWSAPHLAYTADIYHTPSHDMFGYDSRFALDDLINEGGRWAEKLADDWCTDGYLLIVGETPIIPAFTVGYNPDKKWWAEFTDNYYASTNASEPDLPELSIGRIIGDDPDKLRAAIETCISMARGDYLLDNSNAYLIAGPGCNGAFLRHTIDVDVNVLTPKHFDTLLEIGYYDANDCNALQQLDEIYDCNITRADFRQHAQDQDIIHLAGHGAIRASCEGPVHADDLEVNNYDPNSTRPLVCAFWSCGTAKYPAGETLAEVFIKQGASAYIGATSRSDGGGINAVQREFYSNLGPSAEIGRVMRDAKHHILETFPRADIVRAKYNCAVNHLFGDPKMSMSSDWMEADEASEYSRYALTSQPSTNVQVVVPDYVVNRILGKDDVLIPGQNLRCVYDMPIVPIYSHTISLPANYNVQSVDLAAKSGRKTDTGLDLPLYIEHHTKDPKLAADTNETSVEGEGWWPYADFEWSVIDEPNNESVLVINIFPFYYNAATTDVRFYNNYQFSIQYTQSSIEINRLLTDKGIYSPGETVGVEMYLYNPSGQYVDVIVDVVVMRGDFTIVDGLGLRTLRNVVGVASYSPQWDTAGFEPGDYFVEVTIKDTNGQILDKKRIHLIIGEVSGELTEFDTSPRCFSGGEDVVVFAEFKNAGDSPVSGSIIIEVQDSRGVLIEQYRGDFNDLEPNDVNSLDIIWQAQGSRNDYRIIAYALYGSQSTGTMSLPRISAYIDGDFDGNRRIDFEDIAFMTRYWLKDEWTFDIAPAGGDCLVDFLDIAVLCDQWLNTLE